LTVDPNDPGIKKTKLMNIEVFELDDDGNTYYQTVVKLTEPSVTALSYMQMCMAIMGRLYNIMQSNATGEDEPIAGGEAAPGVVPVEVDMETLEKYLADEEDASKEG